MPKEKLPALNIYIGDYLKDDIAGCTLEAQGLWLRMMFIMHESERYGYLCKDGLPAHPGSIARRCGCTPELYESLLAELFQAGVPSKTESGIIYSRRMIKDAELRETRRKAGLLGGRPPSKKSKRKAKQKQNTENEDEKTLLLFEGVWGRYPRKLGRDAALKSFRSALKGGATTEQFGAALDRYIADLREKRTGEEYILHGSTWFNGRWKDWLDYKPPSVGDDTAERREKAKQIRRDKGVSDCHGSTIWVGDDGKPTCGSCHEPQPWYQGVPV